MSWDCGGWGIQGLRKWEWMSGINKLQRTGKLHNTRSLFRSNSNFSLWSNVEKFIRLMIIFLQERRVHIKFEEGESHVSLNWYIQIFLIKLYPLCLIYAERQTRDSSLSLSFSFTSRLLVLLRDPRRPGVTVPPLLGRGF